MWLCESLISWELTHFLQTGVELNGPFSPLDFDLGEREGGRAGSLPGCLWEGPHRAPQGTSACLLAPYCHSPVCAWSVCAHIQRHTDTHRLTAADRHTASAHTHTCMGKHRCSHTNTSANTFNPSKVRAHTHVHPHGTCTLTAPSNAYPALCHTDSCTLNTLTPTPRPGRGWV